MIFLSSVFSWIVSPRLPGPRFHSVKYIPFCRDFAEVFANFDSVSGYQSTESDPFPGYGMQKVITFHVPYSREWAFSGVWYPKNYRPETLKNMFQKRKIFPPFLLTIFSHFLHTLPTPESGHILPVTPQKVFWAAKSEDKIYLDTCKTRKP